MTAVLAASVVTAAGGAARAEDAAKGVATGPGGYRGAKLGMTVPEARKHWQDMVLVRDFSARGPVADPAAAQASSLPLALYRLENQSVLAFKGCEVTARFFEERLYFIQFDCGRQIDSRGALTKAFGDPTSEDPGAVYWARKEATVSLNPKSQVFAFIDAAADQRFQARVLAAAQPLAEPEPKATESSTPTAPGAH